MSVPKVAAVTVLLVGVFADPALATVTVTRAEVSGSRLRVEGTAAPSRDITLDGVIIGRSDGSGGFRIERDPFLAPADCTVDVNDGSATVTAVRLSGCTQTAPPSPTDTTAPTAPVLTAVLSGTTADLSWTAGTDNVAVTGYTITRNGTPLTTSLNPFYNDTNLAVGSYTYTVAATDAAGNISGPSNTASVTVASPPATTDTTAPTTPTGLVTTVVGSTVGLGWELSIDDTAVAGYRVSRNGSALTTTDATTISDTGLAAGTYSYTVAAFDAAGNFSGESSAVSATVDAPATLSFLTPARLPDATVGQPYLGYIVASDPPGPSTFRFKLVSGKVPAGTRFVENTLPNRPEARVTGTPTAAGTSTFTVQVTDGTGAVARRTFTLVVVRA